MPFRDVKTEMTVVISLLVALLLSVLALCGLSYQKDQLKTLIFRQQYAMVSAVAEQLDDKVQTAQTELVMVARTMTPDILSHPAMAQRFLTDRPDTLAMFDNGVYLFSASGKLLSGVPIEPQMQGADFSHRDYFRKTVASRSPQVPEPFVSAQQSRHPIVMFTAPVLDRRGKVIAVLGGSIDLLKDNFLGKLACTKVGKDGYLYLCSDSRLFLVHPDRGKILTRSRPSANPLLDKVLAGFQGTDETVNGKGPEMVSSFKRLNSTGWILAVNTPQTEAYALVHQAQRNLYLALGIALALAFGVVWILMKHMTAPLVSLTNQVRNLTARKDTSGRIASDKGNEIGVLAEAFNALLEELDAQKEEIRKQLYFYQVLLDTIPYPVYHKDNQGRLMGFNKAFEEYLGLPKSHLIGKTAFQFQPGDLAEIYLKADQELYRNGGVQVYEASMAFADGAIHEVIFHKALLSGPDGTVNGIVGTMLDITERKRSEEQLLKLSQAVMQNPVSVVITDRAGNIEFVNPRFTQITGYEPSEALGQNPRMLRSGQTTPEIYRSMWETITSGRIWSGELCNKRKDGSYFWEQATISPIRNAAGTITHYMAFKEEITDRKQLETQLRHAQKMEAIGQLAGGVAHDFNNILTAIMGFGQLLQFALAPEDPKRRHMDQILSAADRAAQLTGSLLAFSRKQVMKLVPTDLTRLAGSHAKFLERVIGADVGLETEFGAEPLIVLADGGQIEQVFMNLATNGRDAMPCGGKLRFKLEPAQLDQEFRQRHGFGEPGKYALLTVSDAGVGMALETQKKIFEPFFTTKEMGRGTGLGLSIVYGIVKQHNGYITVSSELGVGTTFKVYLPLIAQAEQAPQCLPPSMPRGGKETILVAEDDPAVRTLVESVLVGQGYRVLLAGDGQEAVELFHRQEGIDLAVFDVIMPRKSGKEACDELRQLDPQLKVLLLSGYTADLIADRGILVKGVDLMMKPVQPTELARKVREILDA